MGARAAAVAMLPLNWLLTTRGLLFPWVPVFLSAGIGLWFSLPAEPGLPAYGAAALALGLATLGWFRLPEVCHPPLVALGAVLAGVLACGLRLALIEAPVLAADYRGPVQGRIAWIDRSQSDALRLVLDGVVLTGIAPDLTPHYARISLQGQEPAVTPGQVVLITAHLSPPGGPVEPGGFDFQRMAYFDQLGAVGYSRDPLMLWQEAEPGAQWIARLRSWLGAAVRAAVPGDAGAFAAGAMTGDRSGIRQDTVAALRDSNLAHLLAISGQNMVFLTGFVFALLRYGAALVPPLALRVNTKKLAAVVAFGVASFYLLLSGSNVATERAFLMVSVMLGAVLLDRKALTLRSVAISAVLLLLWRPEELLEPGFQLSFAATVVLIAGFQVLDARRLSLPLPALVTGLYVLVLSSVLAGIATAPYAAAHFNRFTDYGLVANLAAGPAMMVLMGSGALAVLLAPLGLAGPALWLMGKASGWILWVAHWIAGLEGAVTPIISPGPAVLPLLTLAGVWVILWQGRLRSLAILPATVGFALWAQAERPVLLISPDARLVGLLGPEGRALSQTRGAGFAAESWLENDGDLASQAGAARRGGFAGPAPARSFALGGISAISLTGKTAAAELAGACAAFDLVVTSAPAETVPSGACVLIDPRRLAETGALAGYLEGQSLVLMPARAAPRQWSGGGRAAPVIVVAPDAADQ